ncbi:dihydrofolate reductase family protein [Granulicoccus phenolivorans]|uniref:dihydrofolate reductase family protein n=1 Tax=Granulicoccus phenolivorans TaxID=266854 RepID=UPI00040405BD|nr:dihydrofolate reductase family protein [Granulicoccus phenolivorans]
MRHIICQSFVSLDGVINHMDRWHFDYTDAEAEAIALEQLRASAGLLMGRGTYEVYAATWPGRTGTYPELINRLPKYVVSSTLGEATWNNTRIISAAPAQAIRALKEEDGPQLLMHGYGPLAKMLLAEGLLDELQLWVHPVLAGVGSGDDLLLREGLNRVLRFEQARPLASGVVILAYRNPESERGG